MSEQTMWAVKVDTIFWRSARETENEAINFTVEFCGVPWEKLQQLGYRTAKYRITEVQVDIPTAPERAAIPTTGE